MVKTLAETPTGGRRIWTGGTFDCLHPGHIYLFKKCSELAGPNGIVTVAINTDEFVAGYKGARPVQSLLDREIMVSAVRYTGATQRNPGGAAQGALITAARTDLIVIGDDWRGRDYLGQLGINQGFLDNHDIAVAYIPRWQNYSSSRLKGAIRGEYDF